MTRTAAKQLALGVLMRWRQLTQRKSVFLPRYVVIEGRVENPRYRPNGHVFRTYREARSYAERSYGEDYALLKLTPGGTHDMTPPVVRTR